MASDVTLPMGLCPFCGQPTTTSCRTVMEARMRSHDKSLICSNYKRDPTMNEMLRPSPKNTQVGGAHYKDHTIQPIDYIMANKLPFIEGNVVKYVTRWRSKGGVQDLKKARHYLDILIEEQEKTRSQRIPSEYDMFTVESSVAQFMKAFRTSKEPAFWDKLCEEEGKELLKEMCDIVYVKAGFARAVMYDVDNRTAQDYLRACRDLEHWVRIGMTTFGPALFMEAFIRVHKSNMSKLGDDGKPLYREDGKVLKGPNYKPPNFDNLFQ